MGGALLGVIKFIIGKIRDFGESFVKFVFRKSKNENSKIKYFKSSKDFARFVGVLLFTTLSMYLVYEFLTDNDTFVDSKKAYDTEISRPDTVTTIDEERRDFYNDPLSNVGEIQFQKNADTILEEAQSTQFTKTGVSYDRCSELMEKFRTFNNLTRKEKKELEECLKNPSMFPTLSSDERKALQKALEEQILSDEEKKIIKDLFGEEKSCQEEFNEQSNSDEGKYFLSRLMQDEELNKLAIDLIKNKDLIIDQKLKTELDFSDEEILMFKRLLEKCSTDLLIKMLSDDKVKEALIKVLESSKNLDDALSQEGLTDEARSILEEAAKGDLTLGSDDQAIADGLLGRNKKKKELAEDITKAREMGDEDLEEALLKDLKGEELTDEEQKLIDRFNSDAYDQAYEAYKEGNEDLAEALRKKAKGGKLTKEEIDEINGESPEDKVVTDEEILDQLSRDLNRQKELERQIAEAQAKAARAAAKIDAGIKPDLEDQRLLKALTDLLEEERRLKERIAESDKLIEEALKRQRLAYERLRKTYQITRGDSLVLVDIEERICSTRVKPHKVTKRNRVKKRKKKGYVYNGKNLTRDEILMYEALMNKKKVASLDSDLFKPLGSIKYDNKRVVATRDDNSSSKIDESFLISNSVTKEIKLSKNQKIAAVQLNYINVTKGGATVRTSYKILHDVYDPITKQKVIPQGSIAHGNSGSFDVQTGIMQLATDTVSIGGRDVSLAFDVGSGDNTVGLKGEVYDQNLNKIAGSLIAAFTSGAINAVQTAYIDPFNDSEDIADLMSGATLGGAAEVSNQILQDVANDLQNSPEIYWVPSNIPVILYPR